jgi:outer membrane immunogenic protein
MKRVLIASAAAVALSASSAFAADMGAPAPYYKAPPPPPPVYSWTGFYIDAGVGYGMWNQDQHEFTTATGAATTASTTDGGRGWLGRFGGGADYQIGSSWVIGAFAEYDVQDIKGTISGLGVDAAGGGTALAFGNEKETGTWYAGGRLGYLITPGLLGYVDGGYTQTRFDSITLMPATATAFAGPRGLPANTYDGWFLGGGYEYALNFSWLPFHGLFWRTEYRYSEYDSDNLQLQNLATGLPGTATINSRPEVQTITSSLVWRFNWQGH